VCCRSVHMLFDTRVHSPTLAPPRTRTPQLRDGQMCCHHPLPSHRTGNVNKTWLISLIVSALVAVSSACGNDAESSVVPPAPPPPYAGKIGVPVHATAPNGATADITLNNIRMKPENCVGSFGCIVVDLTFTGRSTVAFPYFESFVTWNYGGGSDPFNHPNSSK
jgi:hypothetical protein